MNLSPFLELIEEMPRYRELVEELKAERRGKLERAVVLHAAKPYFLACLHRDLGLPMLVITARPEGAKGLEEQLMNWSEARVELFPEPDSLPYERLASDPSTIHQRLRVFSALKGGKNPAPPLIVASAHAVAHKTLSPESFTSPRHTLSPGMEVEMEKLLAM